MRFRQLLVWLVGLLFGLLAVGCWFAPEQMARQFHLEILDISGLSTVRADLGGLFAGGSLLCLIGATKKHRSFLVAAALLLAAVLVGRVLSLLIDGSSSTALLSLAVELVAVVALLGFARTLEHR